MPATRAVVSGNHRLGRVLVFRARAAPSVPTCNDTWRAAYVGWASSPLLLGSRGSFLVTACVRQTLVAMVHPIQGSMLAGSALSLCSCTVVICTYPDPVHVRRPHLRLRCVLAALCLPW